MKEIQSILAPSFLPTSAVLETTYACNHKCLFCSCPWEFPGSEFQKGKELSLDEWKECMAKLVEMGVCSFSYTGGEPLLNKHIFDMIEYADSLKAMFIDDELNVSYDKPIQNLVSNGALINDDVLMFLKRFNVHLSVSLPGLETFNYHTGTGAYRKILKVFNKAKELDIRTTVNIAVTKKNLYELFETISTAFLAGAEKLLINRFLPGGRGMLHVYDLFLNKEELIEMLTVADDVLTKASRSGMVGTEIPICLLKDLPLKTLRVGTKCAAGVDFFVIGPDGRVRTCNHSPIQLKKYDRIEEIKLDSYWRKFTQKDFLPGDCSGCNLMHLCDGGCREAAHVFTGALNGNDPIFTNLKSDK